MNQLDRNKYILIIGGIIFVIIILMLLNNVIRNQINNSNTPVENISTTQGPNPTITVVPLRKLNTSEIIPTLPSNRGQGIDINSTQVKGSETAIKKLSSSLPYNKNFVSSQGVPVEILIPPLLLLENNWTLTIHIFGIDYQLPENDPEYEKNRVSFIEAANDVIMFLESKGINTNDIIVQWGDRAFIQEKSTKWLQQ